MEENGEVLTVSNKRISLEDLSKEDLIKRCKTYLVLAQKAKSARDGMHEYFLLPVEVCNFNEFYL